MHDDEQQQRESISALVDGQLGGLALTHTLAWVTTSPEARAMWHAYHVLGDVLRSPELADCGCDQSFVDRFRDRLAQAGPTPAQLPEAAPSHAQVSEPAQFAPVGAVGTVVAPQRAVQVANDAAMRWRWLAAAASLAAVVVLGWHAGGVDTTQLAAAPGGAGSVVASTAAPGAEPPVMLRDPRLDELVAAHRQFGGTSALQMPAGFLRNATFEPSDR